MEAEYQRYAAVANPFFSSLTARTQNTKVILNADDDSWGWNAGVLFDLSPTMRLGISYRSAIKHTLEGTLNPRINSYRRMSMPKAKSSFLTR